MTIPNLPVDIREAGPEDTPGIASLLAELGYPTTPERMARRLGAILEDPDYRTYVAVLADTPIGLAGTRVGRYYEGDGVYGQLMVLVVSEGYRGLGIGSALVRQAEQDLANIGADNVVVHTGNHRQAAHKFYEHRGYVHTGRRYKKRLQVGQQPGIP